MAGRPKGGKKTGGRAKGVPNKVPKALKDMILGALEDAGGQQYLLAQSAQNPTAFMTLIGKVLPTDIKAAVTHSLTSRVVELPADE